MQGSDKRGRGEVGSDADLLAEDREAYASLADEMNDPDVGPWVESDWDEQAVAGGKRYAERMGLAWPPRTGDFGRFYEAAHRGHDGDHDCDLTEAGLVYDGHVGAPGYGVAFHCADCGRPWLQIGSGFVDPATGPYELSPEDVR